MHALQHADDEVTQASETQGPKLLRWALALVFVWFGALKLRPGGSPIEDLAGDTIHKLSGERIPRSRAVVGLGILEVAVGLGFLSQRLTRPTLAVMWLHLIGASSPLVVYPRRCFKAPWYPTLEGQYILKNAVLAAAGFELASRAKRRAQTDTIEDPEATEEPRRLPAPDTTRRPPTGDRRGTKSPPPRWQSSSRR